MLTECLVLQLVFPLPGSPLDPRRQLSLHQQTQILTDVQQHHRFQQPQPLLYSQQVEFGGEQQRPSTTEKPFLYTQQSQFASQHHKAETLPVPQQQFISQHSGGRAHSATFGARPLLPTVHSQRTSSQLDDTIVKQQQHGNNTTTESSRLSPQQQLRSLRRRPSLDAQHSTALEQEPTQNPTLRPRARLEDQGRETVLADQLYLQNERQTLFQQLKDYNQQQKLLSSQREKLVSGQSQKNEGQQESRTIPQVQTASNDNPLKSQESRQQQQVNPLRQQQQQQQLQAQLQKQFQQQFLQRQELIRKLKLALANAPASTTNEQAASNPSTTSSAAGNSSVPIYLADGQKLQVFQPSGDDESTPGLSKQSTVALQSIAVRSTPTIPQPQPTTTDRPPKVIFDELTKGVLPPGAEFEVIRHKQDGGLEEVGNLPQNLPDKKVTFVFLEEQPDGSVKVQGVRGNNNGQPAADQSNPVDVDSIIKKIEQGDLKLPPSTRLSGHPSIPTGIPTLETTPQESVLAPTYISRSSLESFSTTQRPNSLFSTVSSTAKPPQIQFSQFEQVSSKPPPPLVNFQQSQEMEFFSSVTIPAHTESTTTQSSFIPVDPNFALKKFTPSPTDPAPVVYNSPYSVDVQKQNSETLFVPASSSQPAISSRNQFTVPDYSSVSQKGSQNLVSSIHVAAPPINPVTSVPVVQYSTQKPVTNLPRNHFSPTPGTVTTFTPTLYSQSPSLSPFPVFQSSTPAPLLAFPTPASKPQRSKFVPTAPSSLVDASASVDAEPVYKSAEPAETHGTPTPRSTAKNSEVRQNVVFPSAAEYRFSSNSTKTSRVKTPQVTAASGKHSLSQVLKKEGLFAMAKFLKESGLDNILNDTGPYTVFVPTDKAFRALLIQLGGPDKAEEKFRENPRLLSGLLLHHVIPGAFKLDSLQDEMTGVSLAGTQLRVNTYSTQDVEWNDVQVTTINGARVQRDQHDVLIPQGVAHAVDRVMFPLPVGDVVQTLQADRERRFSKFLRAVQASGLAETLAGSRTFTLFAPTDRAFSSLGAAEQQRLQTDREAARVLVQRHAAPGTLFSAGMRYYQVRPSLDAARAITLLKNAGQLKANNAHVIAHNIPATNGVIHVIDSLL